MSPADIEDIERATVSAVAPRDVVEIDGWVVPFDDGTISRAKSAAPLRHDIGPEALPQIEAAYRARGLGPAFRIADVPSLRLAFDALGRGGYRVTQTTVVKTVATEKLAVFSEGPVKILSAPDDAWAAVFTGDGFDPVDGAYRVAALSRSPDAIFAAAGEAGETHAVGVMTFGHGWAGVHGMRTGLSHRGKGYASAILAALGREARTRGFDRVFLDVEAGTPARRIYRAAGFTEIWSYGYWRKD